jgi:hypothetical protein
MSSSPVRVTRHQPSSRVTLAEHGSTADWVDRPGVYDKRLWRADCTQGATPMIAVCGSP